MVLGVRGLDLLLSGDPRGVELLSGALVELPPSLLRAMSLATQALSLARHDEREAIGVRSDDSRVCVALDGTWLWRPGGERVQLRKRRVLKRLLSALAKELQERPGAALGRRALINLAWPDERKPDCPSAVNRFHVALSTLRQFGLDDALCSSRRGWLLAPERARVVSPDTG